MTFFLPKRMALKRTLFSFNMKSEVYRLQNRQYFLSMRAIRQYRFDVSREINEATPLSGILKS